MKKNDIASQYSLVLIPTIQAIEKQLQPIKNNDLHKCTSLQMYIGSSNKIPWPAHVSFQLNVILKVSQIVIYTW